jgi:hypothetical protein
MTSTPMARRVRPASSDGVRPGGQAALLAAALPPRPTSSGSPMSPAVGLRGRAAEGWRENVSGLLAEARRLIATARADCPSPAVAIKRP